MKEIKKFVTIVEERIAIELLGRLLFLKKLFQLKPNLTPQEYLLSQINGGQILIKDIIRCIKYVEYATVIDMLEIVSKELSEKHMNNKKLVIGLDEASIGMKIFYGKFTSPNGNPRGLLTIFLREISSLKCLSTVCLGTSFSMSNAETIQSDIGKINELIIVTNFKPSIDDEPRKFIEHYIDISDCNKIWEDENVRTWELKGRKRLQSTVINFITKYYVENSSSNKYLILSSAINESIQLHHDKMYSRLQKVFSLSYFNKDIIKRIVIASFLSNGKILFKPNLYDDKNNEIDLVNLGICQLTKDENFKYRWELSEPLAIRVCLEILNKSEKEIIFYNLLNEMYDILFKFPNSNIKGNIFEKLVCSQIMLEWNNKKWSEINIIKENFKDIEIPKWMNEIEFFN
jgi:hypothetical protein